MDLDYIHYSDPDSIWLPPSNLGRKRYRSFVVESLIRYFTVKMHIEELSDNLRELFKNNEESSPNIKNSITNYEFENGKIKDYPGRYGLGDRNSFYCSIKVNVSTSIAHIASYTGLEPPAGPMFEEYLDEVRRMIVHLDDFFSRWSKFGVADYKLTLLNNMNKETGGFRPCLYKDEGDSVNQRDIMEVASYFRVDFEPEAYDLNRKLSSTKGLVV